MLNDLTARLASPARWLVVAGIAYTLASSVLFFLSGPEGGGLDTRGAAGSEQTARAPVDLNSILGRDLFGAATADDGAATDDASPAVATQLPLELRGVFVSEPAEPSAAIIAERGKSGDVYTVGQTVPGNATLVEVHSDHVVLRRAGMRETLHFPQTGPSIAPAAGAVEPTLDAEQLEQDLAEQAYGAQSDEGFGSAQEFVAAYRDRLDEDPQQALAELGVSPVSDGSAEGYRVDDLAQSPYLSQTGLQPGDVILSVNGRPVGDLSQDRLDLDNVLAEGSARLEVQRGTRRFFVTAALQ